MSATESDIISVPPKLRGDLIVGMQKSGETSYVVVKEPESGEFFRLNEAEHFVARQLNGDTTLEEVRLRAEEKFGAAISQESLEAFVSKLGKIGLLDGTKAQHSGPRGRLRGNTFYLRYKLIDPNRLLNALIGRLHPLFGKKFVVFASAIILLAIGTAVVHWGTFIEDLSGLIRPSSLPLLILVSFVVISLHEMAHGLTCKHFGGDVHEMGFMLIYFQPALYCNVSDAWLFPRKSQRLWVGFAGPFFELFLWSLATMAWRFTATGTLINNTALVVMATSGIKTLLNFNPLIKYDGYYLLSDYLEIPNLRRKSFAFLGGKVKALFGFPSQAEPNISRREQRIFFFYGAVATVGTAMFVGTMALIAGDFFLKGNEIIAALLFGLVGVRLRQRFRRLFKPKDSPSRTIDAPAPATGATSKRSKRERDLRNRRLLWTAFAVVLLIFLFVGEMQLKIGGPFAILPVHNADVRAEIDGILVEISVTEGDEVREGDIIGRLSSREHLAELEKTEAMIAQARAKLSMQVAGPTKEEVRLARTAVEKARDRMSFAKTRSERNKALLEKNLISQTEYETTLEQESIISNDLAEATARLGVLTRGPRQEEIEATKAELDRLEAEKRYLEGQLQRVEVRSPVSGIVATPARQLKEMERQMVSKGALIAKVFDMRRLTVEMPVAENEIADVQLGFEVAFKARAYPGRTFQGTVTSIATTARESSPSSSGSSTSTSPIPGLPSASQKDKSVLITTVIDNSDLLLKPGMTGEAKIYCGDRRVIDLITRRLVRTAGIELWSWW